MKSLGKGILISGMTWLKCIKVHRNFFLQLWPYFSYVGASLCQASVLHAFRFKSNGRPIYLSADQADSFCTLAMIQAVHILEPLTVGNAELWLARPSPRYRHLSTWIEHAQEVFSKKKKKKKNTLEGANRSAKGIDTGL